MANIDVIRVGNTDYSIANSGYSISNDYSTTEKQVGTWIDSKPVYQKTVNFGTLPDTSTKNVAHGINNLGKVISMSGIISNGTTSYFLPYATTGTNGMHITLSCNDTNVSITDTSNWSSYSTYITLQYTKTTDV